MYSFNHDPAPEVKLSGVVDSVMCRLKIPVSGSLEPENTLDGKGELDL